MCYLCRCELDPTTRGDLPTGVAAHITAHGDAGPRANPAIPADRRNSIDNLLYLCPSCHSRIDKNSGAGYTVEELLDAKGRHETWTRSLRQAGSAWNVRYHHVDFVNITRLAMLPGADDVLRVAKDIGLDPRTSFRSQGMLAGVFVKRVKPIFENWGSEPWTSIRPLRSMWNRGWWCPSTPRRGPATSGAPGIWPVSAVP